MSDGPINVVLAFTVGAPDEVRARVEAVSPRLRVQVVPYVEEVARRLRRGQRPPIGELAADAPPLTDEQRAGFAAADVILAFDLPVGIGQWAPQLRWVQAIGAGTEHLYGCQFESSVVVTNAAGVAAAPIAEFVMARLLAVWKRFDELAAYQHAHEWRPTYGRLVAGMTLGIVGFGAIGSAVATRAKAFGMHVIAVRRRPSVESPGADEVVGPEGLAGVLARSDAVVVCAPATSDTDDLIDREALATMREGAILCNVARGSLVDEDAVVDALRSGHLKAAILDVTREEPLPADSPLWTTPGVYLSPHSSASLERYADLLFDLFADNLARFLDGRPLRNVVDV